MTSNASASRKRRRGASASRQRPLTTTRKGSAARAVNKRTTAPPLPPLFEDYDASDDERKRRRKKPRVALAKTTTALAVGPPLPRVNRKKLSAKAKQRLKEAAAAAPVAPPAFHRHHASSLRLELGTADLSQDLTALAAFVMLTPEEREFRRRVFHALSKLIRAAFPTARVALYGSSSSGLETFRSDLDITVGNLDLSEQRDVDPSKDEEEDDVVIPEEETSSDVSESETDEPTFSLNLSLPGQRSSSGHPKKALVAASTSLKSPWNPTLRREKMRQLRALQSLLMTHCPQYQIKCLSKAKIPILAVVDSASGLHMDVGVNREAFAASDHGRTTALVTQLQAALGAPFVSIVVFLKEYLHQFDLDKPFTGGLGSYRLYMMTAYVFTTKFPTANASSAKVLLAFLQLFGNKSFLTSETQLPVRHKGLLDVVDFRAVFRLGDCVDKFAMAFDIIRKHGHLGGVVYEDTLATERRAVAIRIRETMASIEPADEKSGVCAENY